LKVILNKRFFLRSEEPALSEAEGIWTSRALRRAFALLPYQTEAITHFCPLTTQ
jgi:hypothetical protein